MAHWTQTPEGKKKLAERRQRHQAGRRATSNDASGPAEAETGAVEQPPRKLGLKVRNAMTQVRDTFIAFSHDFAALASKREAFAPKFVRALRMWQAETNGSVAGFVREFDSSVPLERDGYRSHRTYQAADYLIRLVNQQERAATTPAERAEAIRNAPATPRQALASIIASIAPLLSAEAREQLFNAMETRLHWSGRQVDTLKTDVAEIAPLVLVKAPRGVHVEGELKVSLAPEAATSQAA